MHTTLTPDAIEPFARSIIKTLQDNGFVAYVVGGGIRDRLVGVKPKDFDITTDAHPEQIRALFRNCRLIGHRFRLAHIYHKQHIIEVATFRAGHETVDDDDRASMTQHGIISRDNVYGTLEEDVLRRDFTINALYYDPTHDKMLDLVGGLQDIDQKMVRIIGDPQKRLAEDPVRVLRAIRIANKLQFSIDPKTAAEFVTVTEKLKHIPPGRLFDEYIKLFLSGHGKSNFELLEHYHIFQHLFPHTHAHLKEPHTPKLIALAIENTDRRIRGQLGVNPAFLLAAFLWPVLKGNHAHVLFEQKIPAGLAFLEAVNITLHQQVQHLAFPKCHSLVIRQIWQLQFPLEQRDPQRIMSLLEHMRFRAAYDFLLLRVESGELDESLAEWWTQLQSADTLLQQEMIQQLPLPEKIAAPKRRRRRRKKKNDNPS